MVKILKLNTGEEVTGEFVMLKDDSVVLKRPMTIVYRFHPLSSYPSVKLVKYMIFSKEDTFEFKHSDIVNNTYAREAFVEYYTHVLESFDNKMDESIDEELRNAIKQDKNIKNKFYENLLEQMPTPKNVN